MIQEREDQRLRFEEQIRILVQKNEQQRIQYEKEINTLLIVIQEHESTILNQKGTINSLEELLAKKEDVEDQLAEALQSLAQNNEAREKLQQELDSSTDYILELEEKVYKANKTSLELLKQLKDAEVEIEQLKQYIIDLK